MILLIALTAAFAFSESHAAAIDEPVREKVRVDVIRVPVWARYASGASVSDLRASELTVTVDGRPVSIETIQFESAPGSAEPPATPPSHEESRPVPEIPPVSTFILLDESTSGGLERRDALDQLDRFLARSKTPRRIAVAAFRGARLQMLTSWTDVATGRRTLVELRRHPHAETDPTFIVSGRTDVMAFEFMRRRLLVAVLEAISAFPSGPAKRELVFVTGGRTLAQAVYLPSLSDEGRGADDRKDPSHESPGATAELRRDDFQLWTWAAGSIRDSLANEDVVGHAIERDVAIYAIDAVRAETLADIGAKTLASTAPRPVISTELEAASALLAMSRETGGGLIPRAQDAATGLARLANRVEGSITFRDPFGADHRYHIVEIVCRRRGVSLDYRHGYRIPSDDERILGTVLASFHDRPNGDGPMHLEVSVAPAPSKQGTPGMRLRLRLSPPRAASDTGDRSIDVIAVGRSKDRGSTAPVRWNGTARAAGDGGYESEVFLKVSPAAYTWSLAVRDEATGLVDYTVLEPAE